MSDLARRAFQVAAQVPDPEIPVLTLEDLGILRGVDEAEGKAIVRLSPTYSGCPATAAIELSVASALEEAGIPARIDRVLSPPWTTDWITEAGRAKLTAYGIAPPVSGGKATLFGEAPDVPCPRCGATQTERVSEFGSTPCKAHWRCRACGEPFDYFKCI